MTPSQPGAIQVTDRLERRIRKPIDLLRCVTSGIEIIVLAVAGVAASATTAGVETDITGASARLPDALRVVAPRVALFAILIIPVALAVRQVVRRQVQSLAEAVLTGLLAGTVAAVLNAALYRGFAERLYDAIIMSRPDVRHVAALDPYLAGLVAYATIIGLSGRPGWRNALWLAIGVYGLVHLALTGSTLLSFLLTLLIGNLLVGLLIAVPVGWIGMRLIVSFRIRRRRTAFRDQLPDVLQFVAGSIRAGFSLGQALAAVVREGSQPAADEFSRALAEARIGLDLEVALDGVARRMDSVDLRWAVMAIRIQREVGGNLAEVLATTVATMRERAYLHRHVRSLTAEGRLSGVILIALPLLMGAWLFFTDRTYLIPLYTTPIGLVLLFGSLVLFVLGVLWMRVAIKVEV